MQDIKLWQNLLSCEVNSEYVQNGVDGSFFGPQISYCELFISGHQVFLKFYLISYIQKWVKETVIDFKGKFVLCTESSKWVILGPKIKTSNFSMNLFFLFFWNYAWWRALKSGWKWWFWIFKESTFYAQNVVNGSFWGCKINTSELFSKSVFYVFLKL